MKIAGLPRRIGGSCDYDNNGNVTSRNGQALIWNSANYPTQITGPGETVNLSYDANRQRYKQVYTANGVTEQTLYIGDLLQKVTVNGVDNYRHSIYANGQKIAILNWTGGGTSTTHYLLSDMQGSVAKLTNSDGSTNVSESFTAYGARRNPLTWSGNPTYGDQSAIAAISREGYTGHDALGALGLNHMNGRVQDALTGRFLSADPYISEPGNTQNYNRYSYVYNNPMSYTDPSGFEGRVVDGQWCEDEVGPDDLVHNTHCEPLEEVIVNGHYTSGGFWWSLRDWIWEEEDQSVVTEQISVDPGPTTEEPVPEECKYLAALLQKNRAASGKAGSAKDAVIDGGSQLAGGVELGATLGATSTKGTAFVLATSDWRQQSALGADPVVSSARSAGSLAKAAGRAGTFMDVGRVGFAVVEGNGSEAAYASFDAAFNFGVSKFGLPGIGVTVLYDAAGGSKGIVDGMQLAGASQACSAASGFPLY